MKLAKVAKALGINERTLKLWTANPALAPYFTPSARIDNPSRELNDDDLIVANTIRAWRAGMSNHNVNWQDIADRLASGYREHELPVDAMIVDTRVSVLAQHERTITLTTERDNALARLSELEAALTDERQHRLADVERLLREQQAVAANLARAEVELEMWRSGRLKPE